MKKGDLILHRIIARRNLATLDFAQHEDFDTIAMTRGASFEAITGWPQYLIYCIDSERGIAFLADVGKSATGTHDAPFLYEWQRANARFLLEVPFDRLWELGDARGMCPTFIVSAGRSGSTLLAQLLRALNYSVVSEPDSFTNIATAEPFIKTKQYSDDTKRLLSACVENVRSVWGVNPFIKLRGVCSVLSEQLAVALPASKFIFVLRCPRTWAVSHARAFGAEVQSMVAILVQTVSAYDLLVSRGQRPLLVWYEDLCQRPLETLQTVTAIQLSSSLTAMVRTVMAKDAQANTPLARSKLRDVPISPRMLAQFESLWEQQRPAQILERHGLWRMLGRQKRISNKGCTPW